MSRSGDQTIVQLCEEVDALGLGFVHRVLEARELVQQGVKRLRSW
eukprot:CAMPEP_0206467044 /NCGR_PEP_ID=MMETSP0324_2-20121206/28817_1 /ASSEMBLY_ACC=CAM_ASM_000836 /TAXON_ID=2866 /ORGANISM="Crypthecodinium cohnii, Strain Seligo" /LENGTH=44 /DNA_ID= /DNA_START= /DNA_END= /DNA_ORIENTATION=